MKKTIFALALLGGVAAGAANARAQGQGSKLPPDDQEAQTRLWDAMRAGKWREALLAYNRVQSPTQRQLFLAAQAHYNLGELQKSGLTLEGLLELQEDHLQALYMLARIRAKQGRMDDARTLLRCTARLGQSVLRDLYQEENGELFAELLRDPGFLVQIMRDSQGCSMFAASGRDPFEPPPGLFTGGEAQVKRKARKGTKARAPEIVELEARISTLLSEFRALSRDPSPDVSVLLRKLSELRSVLASYAEYADPDDGSVGQTLERFRQEFDELKGVLRPLQLQLYVADGNHHLRVMARGLAEEQYRGVLSRFDRLKELCARMRSESLSVFAANARMLLFRGKGLADRAALELRASELTLDITGVVLAPAPERNTAVINDQIYEEGDSVVDPVSDEEQGVEIARISNRGVVFKLENLTFTRPLKRR